MSKKFVLASLPTVREDCLAAVLYGEQRAEELQLLREESGSLLGSIYVGKVEKISKNMQAAFVRIGGGQNVYLPLEHISEAVFKTRKKDAVLRPGDELLVQIEKEPMKGKLPRAAVNLHFPGRYMVLTTAEHSLCFSRKLSGAEKQRLRAVFPQKDMDYGVIVRTNAREASAGELEAELGELSGILRRVRGQGATRTCFSCVWQSKPLWVQELNRIPFAELEEIVTDVPSVFENLRQYLDEKNLTGTVSLRLYEDRLLPLYKLYSLETLLEGLLREKVWLKSGGFLMIQQTEAFVAVDVNTGRYMGKKEAEEAFYLMNLEAAREIAAQIRLRQLSGMILIDFINMKDETKRTALLEELRRLTASDPVRTVVVDMTPLNIVEMTRTKERKSLQEQAAAFRGEQEQRNDTDRSEAKQNIV